MSEPISDEALAEIIPIRLEAAPKAPSAAQQLIDLATSRYDLIRGDDGMAYALERNAARVAIPMRGHGSIRGRLVTAFYDEHAKVAPQAALTDALTWLDATASRADATPIHRRVAPIDGGIRLDLGREDHLMVDITASGWKVVESPVVGPVFARSRSTGPMPVPVRGGDIEKLWTVVNVAEASRPLVLVWLLATLFPWVNAPILLLAGEQGTGKTSAGKTLIDLVDPGPATMSGSPTSERDWSVQAAGRNVVGIDNLSTITPSFSDALCRAVTGSSFTSRALYSDADLSILNVHAAVVLTSIDPGALRGDLSERILRVELDRFAPRARLTEADLMSRFTEITPGLLGALLDHVACLLECFPDVTVPEEGLPRMADFASLALAYDLASGETSYELYVQQMKVILENVLDGDPVAAAVLAFVRQNDGRWEGSPQRLFGWLSEIAERRESRDPSWPKTAATMTSRLQRLAPSLRQVGISYDKWRSNGDNHVRLSQTIRTDTD